VNDDLSLDWPLPGGECAGKVTPDGSVRAIRYVVVARLTEAAIVSFVLIEAA
jgi:hypothetical protein